MQYDLNRNTEHKLDRFLALPILGLPDVHKLTAWFQQAEPQDQPDLLIPIISAVSALVVAFLVWFLIFRKRTQQPTQAPAPRMHPRLQLADVIPAWLRVLKDDSIPGNTLLGLNPNNLEPMVIIGLGPIGGRVLSNLSISLNGRYGNKWKERIKFIYVDAVFGKDKPIMPYGLDESQCIYLTPNIDEIRKNILSNPKSFEQWYWYDPNAPRNGRMDGRAALYYDLRNGMSESAIIQAFKAAISPTSASELNIQVISSTFDSFGSSTIIDIIYLLGVFMQTTKDVHLWLMGPTSAPFIEMKGVILSKDEQSRRTLATLREIEMHQAHGRKNFNYVSINNPADKLRDHTEYGVVQTVLLFDPSAQIANGTYEETIDVMSDGLMSTINPSVISTINRNNANNFARVGSITNSQGIGFVNGMGTFSIQSANDLIEDVMSWRMTREVLFGDEIGLFPVEHTDPMTGAITPVDLEKRSLAEDDVYRWFFSLQQHGQWKEFVTLITNRLNELLNAAPDAGEAGLVNRRNSFAITRKWIQHLVEEAEAYPDWEINRRIKDLLVQMDRFQEVFLTDVQKVVDANHKDAQERLSRVRNRVRKKSSIPEDLEWIDYKRYVRQTSPDSPQPPEDQMFKMAHRCGWVVKYDDVNQKWQLFFSAPSVQFTWDDGNQVFPIMTHLSEQVTRSVHEQAMRYANVLTEDNAMELATNSVSNAWLANTKPLLAYNAGQASIIAGQIETTLMFVAPEQSMHQETHALYEQLERVLNRSVTLCGIEDPSILTLMQMSHSIPFNTLDMYAEERWLALSPNRIDHVFNAPKLAPYQVKHRVTGIFLNYLEEDGELLEAFRDAVLSGQVRSNTDEWSLANGTYTFAGQNAQERLESMFKTLIRSGIGNSAGFKSQFSNSFASAINEKGSAAKDQARKNVDELVSSVPNIRLNADLKHYLLSVLDY